MNHYSVILSGRSVFELDTEIKYHIASARIADAKIIRFVLSTNNEDNEAERINGCIIKVLRSVKKEGSIQYFCNKNGLSSSSPEAQFIMNKYSDFIYDVNYNDESTAYFVML